MIVLDNKIFHQIQKAFKTCVKRRYKLDLLQQVIDILRIPDTLPLKNTDHMPICLVCKVDGCFLTDAEAKDNSPEI